MTPWLRRLIGPGRIRDAAPTQPLDDTPAADTWLPREALVEALNDSDAKHWEAVVKYGAFFLVGMLLGAVLAS